MAKPLSEIMNSVDKDIERTLMKGFVIGVGVDGSWLTDDQFFDDTSVIQNSQAARTVAPPAEPRSLLEAMTAIDGQLRALESGVAAMRLAFDALATISGLKP